MRFSPLYLTILLIISCESNSGHFNIKSSDFKNQNSQHYSQKFDDSMVQDEVEVTKNVVKSDSHNKIIKVEPEIENIDSSITKGIFSRFFGIFSSSDERIDSLDQVINDCEERLYTRSDEANSKQSAINSLIGERNYLLKQLDSLQTTLVQSKKMSNQRFVKLENDQRKLKSLIEILSTEIE